MVCIYFILFIFALLPIFLRKKKNEIPGPPALPLIGNALQLITTLPHLKFNKWSEKYGPLYRVMFGPKLALIISDKKLMNDLFQDENFNGRPFIDLLRVYEKDRLGFAVNDGPFYEKHRHFTLCQVKSLGKQLTTQLQSDIKLILKNHDEVKSKSLNSSKLKEIILTSIVHSFWTVLSSNHDGSKAFGLVSNLFEALERLVNRGLLAFVFPHLRRLIPGLIGYKQYRKALDEIGTFFLNAVEERKKNSKKDFISAYLQEIKMAGVDSLFYGEIAEKHLIQSLVELLGGSGDTTMALTWAIFYLCKNKQVQTKFRNEIACVTGSTRNVDISDKPKMPFTLALIDEVLRSSTFSPNGFIHRALKDSNVCGYPIKKDTWILPNLHYIHHNPKIFPEPEKFRPERFLENGKYKGSANFLPFCTGKRQCLGENFARDTIFLVLANIFGHFEATFDPDKKEPGMEPKMNLFLEPKPFSIILKNIS